MPEQQPEPYIFNRDPVCAVCAGYVTYCMGCNQVHACGIPCPKESVQHIEQRTIQETPNAGS